NFVRGLAEDVVGPGDADRRAAEALRGDAGRSGEVGGGGDVGDRGVYVGGVVTHHAEIERHVGGERGGGPRIGVGGEVDGVPDDLVVVGAAAGVVGPLEVVAGFAGDVGPIESDGAIGAAGGEVSDGGRARGGGCDAHVVHAVAEGGG